MIFTPFENKVSFSFRNRFSFITTVRFISAPEITTTEGKISVKVSEVSLLFFSFFLSLLTIEHFIPAPEITTTEGKISGKCI